jgi:hypothetical protein
MTIDEHIHEVLDELDFQRIYRAMLHLNWQWASAEDGVPNIPEMRKQVRKLMKSTYSEAMANHRNSGTCIGGFDVDYDYEHDIFDVKFVLAEWRTDYEVT